MLGWLAILTLILGRERDILVRVFLLSATAVPWRWGRQGVCAPRDVTSAWVGGGLLLGDFGASSGPETARVGRALAEDGIVVGLRSRKGPRDDRELRRLAGLDNDCAVGGLRGDAVLGLGGEVGRLLLRRRGRRGRVFRASQRRRRGGRVSRRHGFDGLLLVDHLVVLLALALLALLPLGRARQPHGEVRRRPRQGALRRLLRGAPHRAVGLGVLPPEPAESSRAVLDVLLEAHVVALAL